LAAIREFSDAAREEWGGEEALICTCFFVSERTIEREILSRGLQTVSDVTRVCSAGGGCGSCHQLIQEILDTQHDLPR
jgi:NifU-like protein